MGWITVEVPGKGTTPTIFKVPDRLKLVKRVGSGAYGTVASFQDTTTGEKIAVKKITNAFDDLIDGKRILREVTLLRHISHDNIISILDMYPPESPDFEDIYIITDLMETDLHRVIYSKQDLTEEHAQYFTYQILRGLLYLHSANIVHRDLKPANILVNKNCDLKICDFGLARGFAETEDDPTLTDYVVTRWYRAPEVVLLASEYTKAIDIWSVGCILCELIGRKPLFTGKDHLDQIKKIVKVLGTPSDQELAWLPENGPARKFIHKQIEKCERQPWNKIYPSASEDAVDIIDKMLKFDPTVRISVKDSLCHKYFEQLHVEDDEPLAEKTVDWSFDAFKPTKRLLQNYIYAVCAEYRPEIKERDRSQFAKRGMDKIPSLMN